VGVLKRSADYLSQGAQARGLTGRPQLIVEIEIPATKSAIYLTSVLTLTKFRLSEVNRWIDSLLSTRRRDSLCSRGRHLLSAPHFLPAHELPARNACTMLALAALTL
jgi:hypothetical protein